MHTTHLGMGLWLLFQPVGLPPAVSQPDGHACTASITEVDDYLWGLYEKTPKVDRDRKTKKDVDFAWKDVVAAKRAGMSQREYVIGGIDRTVKVKSYWLFKALDAEGLQAGFTSGFRDDYRQQIATGKKARPGRSHHGGSLHGGYGHGKALDIVALAPTRGEQLARNGDVWGWIDTHGKYFGLGRPYGNKDAPHVGPTGPGTEYAAKHDKPRSRIAKGKDKKKYAHKSGKKKTKIAHVKKKKKNGKHA